MAWQTLCFILLLVSVVQTEANRSLKLDPVALNFWRSLFATVLFSLPLPFVESEPSIVFILSGILVGVISGVSAISIFHIAKKHGSKVASLSTQTTTLVVFFMWLPFDWDNYTIDRFSTIGAAFFLISGIVASYFLNRSPITKAPIKILLALSVLIGGAAVIGKLVLPYNIRIEELLLYSFIIMGTQTLVSLVIMLANKRSFSTNRKMLKWSSLLSLVVLVGCPLSWLAVIAVPNPSYLQAILMLTPAVLYILHRARNIKESIPLIPTIVLTVSMIGLTLVA